MELKEFVEKFICKNSLIKLWYPMKGGYKVVIENDKDSICMEWKIVKGTGLYSNFIKNKVIGVTDIFSQGPYPEAINIVIEEIPLELVRNNKLNELGI